MSILIREKFHIVKSTETIVTTEKFLSIFNADRRVQDLKDLAEIKTRTMGNAMKSSETKFDVELIKMKA